MGQLTQSGEIAIFMGAIRPDINFVRGFVDIADPYAPSNRLVDTAPWRWLRKYGIVPQGLPMRASGTLLASWLKKGWFSRDDFHKHNLMRKLARDIPDPLLVKASEESAHKQVKSMPGFIGRLLGVEIEYYPQGDPVKQTRLCVIAHDGSLSVQGPNGQPGSEIRKLTWADKDGRLSGVLALPLKGRVDGKCGLHVHVDARHLDGSGPRYGAVRTYERLLEFIPHIKRLVPSTRHENQYCKWLNNCNKSTGFELDSRYAAINWQAFPKHGTIEFRCQSGSTNRVKIESWALLCQHLLNWASIRANVIPPSWDGFLAIIPEPLRSWAIMREQSLREKMQLNERVMSASDPE